ncbi:MAG: hypothetical protein M9936_22255 [Caldilinea sp.]|nr:hypothetical protein [Caldilinea sp.]MCB0058568.1 hypothetical protein [Caldilineaceae bacterium]MCB0038413.1 hypothetical protein [Caldilinea sp.]MCB0066956.1 hypothetical protein [Caldilineaceae bacterium]MCB0134278.1 hypothetical protein [Caldilineaceae bacterium]
MRRTFFAILLVAAALLAACNGAPASNAPEAPALAADAESITVYKSPT